MSSRRRHVMNDDILLDIFKRLDIKDLFSLQRVSQQFSRCSQQVLKKKREVSVGFNDLEMNSKIRRFKPNFEIKDWNRLDITTAISFRRINFVLNHNRNQNMESIVRQFRDVKNLYLSSTEISFKTLELIVNQWPHLEELLVHDIEIYDSSDKTITEWTQLLSKIKHITTGSIDSKYVTFISEIIANLPSLQSVNVLDLLVNNDTIALSVLTHCLPANIQCLTISVTSVDSQAIDVITTKCTQIKKLSICEFYRWTPNVVDYHLWKQWFLLICDRLKALTYFKITLADISAKEFAQNIAKLKHLRILDINFGHINGDFPRLCFDTQKMAKYMRPMVSLKTLSLDGVLCSPNRWSNFFALFPNVRQLTLNFIFYCTDCKHVYECNDCFYRCMDFVSKLPKLKHICFSYVSRRYIPSHILELFASVDQLTIDISSEDELIDELIHFIIHTLDNRRREFRLNLRSDIKRELIQRMETMDIPMNGCMIFGHVFGQ